MKANIVTIVKTDNGVDVDVQLANGVHEHLEGLYDEASAFAFGRMVLCYNSNKYR